MRFNNAIIGNIDGSVDVVWKYTGSQIDNFFRPNRYYNSQ